MFARPASIFFEVCEAILREGMIEYPFLGIKVRNGIDIRASVMP
jgi:hypothetical protein